MQSSNFTNSNLFIKENVSLKEYKLHKYTYNLDIVPLPEPISYDKLTKKFTMRKIPNMCISDFYGDKAENVPDETFEKIRLIIKTLYEHNISYPDITGYNFIELGTKVYIIDFGHARFDSSNKDDKFILKFINGAKEWNPDFA